MSRSLPLSRPRLAAVSVLTLFAIFVASSCRSIVAGDGRDASTELCDLLKRCYGPASVDCAKLSGAFGVDAKTDDAFLAFLAQNDCLSSCNDAKKCADYPPVCARSDKPCERTSDCCESTLGHQVCQASQCCAPVGVPCTLDADCCPGVQCKRVGDTDQRTCSGVVACKEVGDACGNDIDCCSKACQGGVCRQKICSSIGEKCSNAEGGPTCCPAGDAAGSAVSCVDGACVLETCHASTCGDLVPCDPKGDPTTACCGSPTLRCVADVLGDYGVCVDVQGGASALPDGFDCAYGTDCCSGACLPTGTGYQCGTPQVGCVATNDACVLDATTGTSDCCFGDCVDGRCACGGTSCHSSYEEGAPIDCQPGDPLASPQCDAKMVCAGDPFCCCNQWDAICVGEAFALCGPPLPL